MKRQPTELEKKLIQRISIVKKVAELGLTQGTRQRAQEQLTRLLRTLEQIRGTDNG